MGPVLICFTMIDTSDISNAVNRTAKRMNVVITDPVLICETAFDTVIISWIIQGWRPISVSNQPSSLAI
jgi:hydroxymethylpyrimidine/phosphomethylpyrimidine kinase